MLRYADQPTPPFNSPYQQHTLRKCSLLEASYPSSERHDTSSKYAEGLGLYGCYQPALATGLPPSPQPSESWNARMSPLTTEAIADPWASGAFDHPVSHSPLPWTTHPSPRSSLSSCTREMSVFSHDDQEQSYAGIKVEYTGWAPDMRWGATEATDMPSISSPQPQPLTVAPERLNVGLYSFEDPYESSHVPKVESSPPVYDYGGREYDRAPSEESQGSQNSKARSNYSSTSVPRERGRNRRHTDPANAAHRCPICENKGFARRYNYSQHMLTHDITRKRDHVCSYPDCKKEFVRKTDLSRHHQSVHERSKPWKCSRCPQAFSRKDTLRRHEEDGCTRRNQVPVEDSQMLSHLRSKGYQPATAL